MRAYAELIWRPYSLDTWYFASLVRPDPQVKETILWGARVSDTDSGTIQLRDYTEAVRVVQMLNDAHGRGMAAAQHGMRKALGMRE